jgi:hypothetical protein
MTLRTNARIAGLAFLVYIAAGIASMIIYGPATTGSTIAEKLVSMAGHPTAVSVNVILNLLMTFCALALGITLWGITREQDPHLAMLGMTCRVVEGVLVGLSIQGTRALNWLATATGPDAPDPGATHALAAYLLKSDMPLTASFFAAGSTIFAFLLLRGRMIPASLAWIGVVASVLLLVCLPLQLAGFLSGTIATIIWLPMVAFEVPVGLWFIFKGVARPSRHQDA